MELWYTEYQTPSLGISLKIKRTLHREKSAYQDIAVIETEQFGRMLVLDGTVQTSERDEYIYHEMITHVPLSISRNPEKVLVVGGGDGGVVREVLKHESIRSVVLAEIDERVVEISKKYLPGISCGLDDRRVEVIIGDGIEYVRKNRDVFDVIIVDSTDPVGAAEGLFNIEFYKSIEKCLTDSGVVCAQTESPFLHTELIKRMYGQAAEIFSGARLYTCPVPTYPGGYWSFTLGIKDTGLMNKRAKNSLKGTRYWTPEIHNAAFVLPRFLEDIIGGCNGAKQ